MNNSFEQFFKKGNNPKHLSSKNGPNAAPNFKKEGKNNANSKNKNYPNYNESKHQNESYNYLLISNHSIQKSIGKVNTNKSNHKKSKRQDINTTKNKQHYTSKTNFLSQITKKQKQIREAIDYRFQKSKIKEYKFTYIQSRIDQSQESKARHIIDLQEQQKFSQQYAYLSELKVVNLYDYHQFKQQHAVPHKEKSNNKIIVIKNSKKKRQNSDTIVYLNHHDNESENIKSSSKRLILNTNNNYFSNNSNNIQSQRNHTEVSKNHRNKSESPAQSFRIQFPSSHIFQKQKSGSRSKIKTDYSLGLNDKINTYSSVQKKFKSIKEIYLNAITNMANKNTVKSNHKLFKGQNQAKNKGSKSLLSEIQKNKNKSEIPNRSKHENSSKQENTTIRQDKVNSSSCSALNQNYFSCISSRQNKKQQKNSSLNNNRKPTNQRLDKTVLISQANSSQWKSIIMKVGDASLASNKQKTAHFNDHKKLKLKLKDEHFNCHLNKNYLKSAEGRFLAHPHSYRQYTKSPKFKRFIVNQDDQNVNLKDYEGRKNVTSVKNLNNQSYQTLLNQSQISSGKQGFNLEKRTKK